MCLCSERETLRCSIKTFIKQLCRILLKTEPKLIISLINFDKNYDEWFLLIERK